MGKEDWCQLQPRRRIWQSQARNKRFYRTLSVNGRLIFVVIGTDQWIKSRKFNKNVLFFSCSLVLFLELLHTPNPPIWRRQCKKCIISLFGLKWYIVKMQKGYTLSWLNFQNAVLWADNQINYIWCMKFVVLIRQCVLSFFLFVFVFVFIFAVFVFVAVVVVASACNRILWCALVEI